MARACEAGAVGASIEDATGDRDNPIYEFELTVDRVRAAVEAVRSLPVPFMLTARAEDCFSGMAILTISSSDCSLLKRRVPIVFTRQG